MEPFIVKHYSEDERPIIKGNGFDGLEIGGDREEAQEFVDFVNKLIQEKTELRQVGCVVETYAGHGSTWDGSKSVYPAALTSSVKVGTELYVLRK